MNKKKLGIQYISQENRLVKLTLSLLIVTAVNFQKNRHRQLINCKRFWTETKSVLRLRIRIHKKNYTDPKHCFGSTKCINKDATLNLVQV